jgi:hypothetical protein
MSLYASLDDVRNELNAENTVDDAIVMGYIRSFSRRIDRLFMQRGSNFFVPQIATRSIFLDGLNINSWNRTLTLRTPDGVVSPILDMTSASINGQALVIGTNVQLFPTEPSPYTALQLLGDTFFSWYSYCSDAWGSRYAAVTGVWGYNADYTNAWVKVTTLAEAINDSVKTFDVTDLGGGDEQTDEDGIPITISAGSLIQIDSEWMNVVSTTTTTVMAVTTYTVTVKRGVNGSTAAAHLDDAPIAVYMVDNSIRRAVTRQAALMYARKGAFEVVTINDFNTTQYPSDLLREVNEILELFANL